MALVKEKNGWVAEDQFEFNGPRRLCIRTYKGSRGITTFVSVNKYHEVGFEHCFGLSGGGDFSASFAEPGRGTEKAIGAQHARYVARKDEFLAQAKAHYEKYPPWR